MSLYLKYRPQQFNDLYGQNHIKLTLQKGIELGKVAHAYLFCGPRGTGKTTSARLIAKSLNCTDFDQKANEPCNKCDICNEINNGSLVDVLEIDAASNRGIDEIRELRESVKFAPYKAKNKIYIIDEVHMLTNEAFNALLKTLEEPPKNVYFILATTEVHKIPDTIISRCQRFDFKKISEVNLTERIKYISEVEKLELPDDVLSIIVKKANGGMRDAISLLDQVAASGLQTAKEVGQVLGVTPDDVITDLFEIIVHGQVNQAMQQVMDLNQSGYGIKQINFDIICVLKNLLEKSVQDEDTAAQSRYLFLIDSWQSIWNLFKESAIPDMVLEIFVVKTANHFAGININMPTPLEFPQVSKVEAPQFVSPKQDINQSSKPVVAVSPVKKIKKESKVQVTPTRPEVNDEVKNQEMADIMNTDVKLKRHKKAVESIEINEELNEYTDYADVTAYSDEQIEQAWKNTVENIKTPLIKRTLQPTKVAKEQNQIIVKFNSNFHFRQIEKPEFIKMIEDEFAREVGGKVDLKFIVDTSLAIEVQRQANSKSVKPNAFEINPLTGKSDSEEEFVNNGVSVDEIADFFS